MKKQNSHPKQSRRSQVNNQRLSKETRTKFSSRHVGRTLNVHELVTNNNPSIQAGKEAPGHSIGHQ
jgi:hypothetical protein